MRSALAFFRKTATRVILNGTRSRSGEVTTACLLPVPRSPKARFRIEELAAVFRADRRETRRWRPAGQPEYALADCAVAGVGGSE